MTCSEHGRISVYTGRFQRDDVQAAEAVSHGRRARRPLDANVRGLAARRRVGPADDFPFAAFIDKAVTRLELHREDPACGGRAGAGFFWGRSG